MSPRSCYREPLVNGPEGLLKSKRLISVLASGGVYSNGPAKQFDFQEPYLRTILGFIGLTEIEVARVEGLAMSTVGAEKPIASATAHSREILARAARIKISRAPPPGEPQMFALM